MVNLEKILGQHESHLKMFLEREIFQSNFKQVI